VRGFFASESPASGDSRSRAIGKGRGMAQLSNRGRLSAVLAALAASVLLLSGCAAGFSAAVNPVGVWAESDDDDSPNLTLHKDGDVTGFDGCNQVSGHWEATDDGVNFGPFAGTMMACDGVDTWLNLAASASIAYDTMTVLDEDGRELGTLERTED
jgi:heat shock protein HslJ